MKLINGLLRIFVLFLTIERGSSTRIVHTDIVLELELWIQFTVAYAVELCRGYIYEFGTLQLL